MSIVTAGLGLASFAARLAGSVVAGRAGFPAGRARALLAAQALLTAAKALLVAV